MAAINEDIKKIKDQIEILRTKIEGANEARRGQGVRRTQMLNVDESFFTRVDGCTGF